MDGVEQGRRMISPAEYFIAVGATAILMLVWRMLAHEKELMDLRSRVTRLEYEQQTQASMQTDWKGRGK